jgi:UDP-2-acetamido-3-amino-2,3-dideoxy-glucuronate N-acetyltransferase
MSSYYAHESSCIDEGADIGSETKIMHFCRIVAPVQIGRNCQIGQNVYIEPDCKIGNNVTIENNVSIYTGVTIEDDVFLGTSIVFTNRLNPRSHGNRESEILPTLVKRGASIGANATIICGVTLGNYSFIGAGSVVTKDVPDYGLCYGNPARLHGWMCQCGMQLKRLKENRYFCPACADQYNLVDDRLIPCGKDV